MWSGRESTCHAAGHARLPSGQAPRTPRQRSTWLQCTVQSHAVVYAMHATRHCIGTAPSQEKGNSETFPDRLARPSRGARWRGGEGGGLGGQAVSRGRERSRGVRRGAAERDAAERGAACRGRLGPWGRRSHVLTICNAATTQVRGRGEGGSLLQGMEPAETRLRQRQMEQKSV